MGFDLSNATSNIPVTVGFFVSLIGWVISMAGLVTAQVSVEGPYASYWWALFLTIVITFAVLIALLLGKIIRLRSTLLGFVVLGASQLTTCLTDALSAPHPPVLAMAAGMTIMALSFYSWIISLGMLREDPLNQPRIIGVPKGASGSESGSDPMKYRQLPDLKTISKNPSTSSESSAQVHHHQQDDKHEHHRHHDSHEINGATTPILNVRALYGYDANPNDPNELSFAKGELLHVLDKNGKWWKARKQDGTVGIIPSNYVEVITA